MLTPHSQPPIWIMCSKAEMYRNVKGTSSKIHLYEKFLGQEPM